MQNVPSVAAGCSDENVDVERVVGVVVVGGTLDMNSWPACEPRGRVACVPAPGDGGLCSAVRAVNKLVK